MRSFLLLLFLAMFVPGSAVWTQEPAKKEDAPAKKETPGKDKEGAVKTRHTVALPGGKQLDYEAIAGLMTLKDDDGKPRADISFTYYRLLGDSASKRPITFTFNGGPGSSSVWLHMGAFGPKKVAMNDAGEPLPPPYKLVENEFTLLDLTDLVFIDPVGTGYSRPATGQTTKAFTGVTEDISSVGDFIYQFTNKYERWSSAKFLAGESYGTTRASGLSGYLQDTHGMNLNGIMLISAILNFQTARFDEGNDLPYILFLPTYTATAWYHKKLNPELQKDLEKTLAEVEKFAENEYTLALMKGAKLSEEDRQKIAQKLGDYTGLSKSFLIRANLRVDQPRFCKELLRSDRLNVGRYDSRLKGIDKDAAGERPDYDPSYASVQGTYTAMFNDYMRNQLNYKSELKYEILTGKVQPWEYGPARNRYLNVAPTLRAAMTANKNLKLFVASGHYDLATPYFATNYTLDHLGLEPEVRKNIRVSYYEAGHMMYAHKASHEKLRKDIEQFYKDALTK
ncbi:hypothetical protein KIH39_14245 [Telmatocola sphagniphila]|uniref:Peptidase S10 n=1 Tax=Telmatocola sphagniphila TaxID=1123043 RepID=A0A8E6ETF5_9BACT|nr:hypothetical protein [Telmatocola sphagniphila]QVL30025.1 hypothetical protein KIH39_14245 [Telmatocola sphagniphila]